MAAVVASNGDMVNLYGSPHQGVDDTDPFMDTSAQLSHMHRFSSQPDPESLDTEFGASPAQVKRTVEAHLREIERQLLETQKLGTSLLHQQTELTDKLKEVDEQQEEVPVELRQRLTQLGKEHDDIGREVARALLPRSRNVSGEEKAQPDSGVYTSQANASPSKVSAPSRRHRNQPSKHAGDLQFAADISTSLLAQVRQLQAAVAERDETIKNSQVEQSRLEQDTAGLAQKVRALDENEQRYKDENWNLETHNHQLQSAARDAAEKEKRLSASLAAALADKSRIQNEVDEVKVAHGKLNEEHAATKKAHDSELHTLRRTVDQNDNEKLDLHTKIDELTAQNQELAQAINARFRNQQGSGEAVTGDNEDEEMKNLSTPEQSPPPSPTKATPRHPGLESETLRSSLHHAHRMIQNLKNNIHREKTEKIELKRMLQDARDELERNRDSPANGNKRQKAKDSLRKGIRPDMLGGNRKARTDVEIDEEDWEEHNADTPSHGRRILSVPGAFRTTDVSDAYATSTETEGAFETADEKNGTESEDFQTGAESIAGDSTDDLTETEDNTSRTQRTGTTRGPKLSALASKRAGDRTSFMSTASTSAGEDEDDLQTPIQVQHKFRLKNGRQSLRQSRQVDDGTPQSVRALSTIEGSSPATVTDQRSPPGPEQSLYAELGEFDDGSSGFGTPGRGSIASAHSTPYNAPTPSKRQTSVFTPAGTSKPATVDAGIMTEPWQPTPTQSASDLPETATAGAAAGAIASHVSPSPSGFPLPPSVPQSPVRKTDTSTQWTPQRSMHESPARNMATFITPPKTVWDEEAESIQSPQTATEETSRHPLEYSGMLTQDTMPVSPPRQESVPGTANVRDFSAISTLETEPASPQSMSKSMYAAVTGADADQGPESKLNASEKATAGAAGAGILASAAAALGSSRAKSAAPVAIAEDETSEAERHHRRAQFTDSKRPLSVISENNVGQRAPKLSASKAQSSLEHDGIVHISSNDQGSQTLLTSEQIDQGLKPKLAPVTVTGTMPSPFRDIPVASTSPVKRPTTASSQRSSSLLSQQHPPLPADHKNAIEKAAGRVTSPSREPSNSSHAAVIMGPPAMPASAMRRPRTPAESSLRSPSREATISRPSHARLHQRMGTENSQMSRRSSVSSFASELDERFNIQPHAQTASHGFEASPGTDPRMIQAITQTMIGEFLWKYTRKAGRAEMSDTRHRRYFWVHPYTKTLYWSDSDPQTAGRAELKAKSVAIESVRVVTDDNPMPPGLHRKSLEVTTPGRKVKFTASTGQRHETWFNALSYLLLRSEHNPDGMPGPYTAGNTEITKDDINEFNVGGNGYGARLLPSGSRVSMSSYNSRTTRGTSANRNSVRQSQQLPPGVTMASSSRQSQQPQQYTITANSGARMSRAEQPREADQDRTVRAGSTGRFSRMIGSITGRTSRSMNRAEQGMSRSESGSIYDASLVSDGRKDSAEEMRREMLRQEREGLGGGLENVRACCDGKHDVSTLSHSHSHRHLPPTGHGHRGMSLRGTISRRSTNGVN